MVNTTVLSAPLSAANGLRAIHLAKRDRERAPGDRGDVAQDAAARDGGVHPPLPVGIEPLERLEKRGERQAARRAGHQRLDHARPELAGKAEQAPEDQRLAPDVHAGQVVARIGLGVAALHRVAERRRERAALAHLVEQEAERSRERSPRSSRPGRPTR